MGQLMVRLTRLFATRKLEIVMVGLENSGKTTLLNLISMGRNTDTTPTVGLQIKSFRHGGVAMKVTFFFPVIFFLFPLFRRGTLGATRRAERNGVDTPKAVMLYCM